MAAVKGPQCGQIIWVKNCGTYGTSVNNGVGTCITATLVDEEGGGSVGKYLRYHYSAMILRVFANAHLQTLIQPRGRL